MYGGSWTSAPPALLASTRRQLPHRRLISPPQAERASKTQSQTADAVRYKGALSDRLLPNTAATCTENSINNLQIGHKIYPTTVNPAGTTRTPDTSGLTGQELEQRVFAYASELAGNTPHKPHPTKPGVWYANLSDGSIVNVRSVSSSNVSRWTIDVRGPASDINDLPKYEIKFK